VPIASSSPARGESHAITGPQGITTKRHVAPCKGPAAREPPPPQARCFTTTDAQNLSADEKPVFGSRRCAQARRDFPRPGCRAPHGAGKSSGRRLRVVHVCSAGGTRRSMSGLVRGCGSGRRALRCSVPTATPRTQAIPNPGANPLGGRNSSARQISARRLCDHGRRNGRPTCSGFGHVGPSKRNGQRSARYGTCNRSFNVDNTQRRRPRFIRCSGRPVQPGDVFGV